MKKMFSGILGALLVIGWAGAGNLAMAVDTTVVVTGSTTAAENDPGEWFFNRDVATSTPYEFNEDAFSIGQGSLYVLPIGATASNKFIGEYFINEPVADVESVSYDFKIGSGGVDADKVHFYMSVYANFGESDDLKFYDCRYSVVPAAGSTDVFTTVTFDPTQAYPVTKNGSSPYNCPAVPADMDNDSPGSNIRVFALNVGDTSTNDVGLDGYLDNVVVDMGDDSTIFDFEDDDGLFGEDDICPGTEPDAFSDWGRSKGRYMWDGTDWVSSGKGDKKFVPDMEYTYGCSGKQILDAMAEATGEDFTGHYKHGLSKSILEAWHEGTYHMETVTVPADDADGVSSLMSLIAGQDYLLRASGTGDAGDGIEFDADYSFRTGTSTDWTDAVSTYEYLGDTLLDLMVDGGFVNWDDDAVYNANHVYWYAMAGAGDPVSFQVNDTYPANNTGALTVDIYAKLW